MDFYGTKRRDLQSLCKKHGIPANLKNSDMATRLASLFEKETEEIVTDTKRLPEEADGVKDNLVVKKVRFSPDNEVFEFTRSVQKRKQRNVRPRSQGTVQDFRQSGIKVRRSTRIASKGVTVAESSENESNTIREIVETDKSHKVARRSKRIGSSGCTQEEECRVLELIDLEQFEDTDISNELSGNNQDGFKFEKVRRQSTRLIAKRSKGLVEDELVKNNTKEVSMDFEVQETGKYHKKDVQDPTTENVCRRSRRFVSDIDEQTNAQVQRRLTRLKASAASPSMGGGTSDGRALCSAKENKEERRTTKPKRSVAVNCQEGKLVKNITKEPLIDCLKVQDESEVDMVPRRSKRLGNDVNLLMDENVKATQQSRKREKSVSALLVVDQAQKCDEQSKRTSGNDCEDKKLPRRSKCTALDNMKVTMVNSPKRCSLLDNERDGPFYDNVKKLNVNDEMQVRVRFTRNSSRNGSCKAPIVVEGNLVEKKMDATLVKSSKVVAKRMKRSRSAVPEKLLDENAHVENAIVDYRGSSKKSKTMNQEYVKDRLEGMIEDSPSFSRTKNAESVMINENVLDSTLEYLVDSSQRTNTQELNSKLVEGEREEKLKRDTTLMALIEEENVEVVSHSVRLIERVSPASVQLVGSTDAEQVVSTGHILGRDTEEYTKTKDQALICTPKSKLKEHSSEAKSAKVKDDEKGSLEKEVQAANLLGNVSECNTENSSVEEEMETIKVGRCVNLTPEKLLDEEEGCNSVEAGCSFKKLKTVNQEVVVKDNPQGMVEDSPSTSETKATEPITITENALVCTVKVAGDISLLRKIQECDSELVEREHVEKCEQETVLKAATKEKEEATLSVSLIECSEVKAFPDNCSAGDYLSEEMTPPPTSLQLEMSNPEAKRDIPTGHILVKDIVSTVITVEDTKTKEDTLVCTPRTEFKEHSFVANLAKAEVALQNLAECGKEIHSNKGNEKGSLEKDLQAANSHGNFFDYNTEHSIAEEMEIRKVGCVSVGPRENETPQKLFDAYTQLEPEEARAPNVEARGSVKKIKTVNQGFEKEKPQGIAEDSPSTSETKATPILSGDISLVRNIQESNSELMEEEPEEKQEQYTVLMAATEEKDIASTVVPEEDIITKEEILVSISSSELKEHSFVTEPEVIMENSAECWNAIHSCKDDEKGSLEKETQVPNLHGNFSEYIAENGSAIEHSEISKAACVSAGHCVNRETVDEVKDDSVEKSERTISSERGCNALKLSRWLSTEYAAPSPKEENVSECLEKAQMKAVSNAVDESAVSTTRERNLMLMEQLSECRKIHATKLVTLHNDEAVESHAIVFTTPEKVLSLEDSVLDETEKEVDHTATQFPNDSDVSKATDSGFMLGGSRKNVARNEGEGKNHDGSNIATSPMSLSSVGGFKGDGIEKNEEKRTVEFPCDSGTCTSPDRHVLLGNLLSDRAEDSSGSQGINRVDKSGLILTSLEKQLFYGDSEQKEAVKTEEKAVAEFHDKVAFPFLEDSEMNEAAKSEENEIVEVQVDCGIFTSAEKNLLLETAEEMKKGDNSIDKSHVVSDDEAENEYRENMVVESLSESNISTNLESHLLSGDSGLDGTRKIKDNVAANCEESFGFISPKRRLQLGNSEPHNAGNQEQKEVEFKNESAFFTRLESHLLLGDSGQDRLDIGKSGKDLSHHASSPKVGLKENSVVRGSHLAALNFGESTDIDSNGRTASKVSYSHEFNALQETAGIEVMPKSPHAESVIIQGTKQRKRDLVRLFAFDIQEGETIIEAERNISLCSNVLDLPAKDNSSEELRIEDTSETIGEISSHLEVAGMVSGESGYSIDIQNHLNDAHEAALAMKGNNEADELIEAKVTTKTQIDCEGNLLLDSSGNSYFSEKTSVIAGMEDELSRFESEVYVSNTCVKSRCKIPEEEATGPAFEEAISLTPQEFNAQDNSNQEDEDVIRRETTPSPEETMNESFENRNKYDKSGTLSEKEVRREPLLIYGTQVKPNENNMKENEQNSKIVHNLNITAPRTTKRKPLQDLRNN